MKDFVGPTEGAKTELRCDHVWRHQGTVYWPDAYTLPSSDARAMHYGDRYFCEKCLQTTIRNDRIKGNTYSVPIAGTFPK